MVTAHGQTLSSLPTYTQSLVLSVAKLHTNVGVRIGLYTISSRRGLCMGCCIVKGVSERCIAGVTPYNQASSQHLSFLKMALQTLSQEYTRIIHWAPHFDIVKKKDTKKNA